MSNGEWCRHIQSGCKLFLKRLALTAVALLAPATALASGCTLPADVSTRIGRAQEFTYQWAAADYNLANLSTRDYYWANGGDVAGNTRILDKTKFFSSSYTPMTRIIIYNNPAVNFPGQPGYPQWQLVYDHPDWIIYKADKSTFPQDFDGAGVAVDISNPAVQSWKETNEDAPIIAAGWNAVAMDNGSPRNDFGYRGAWKTSPVNTLANGGASAGATSIALGSTTGFGDGQQVIIQGGGFFRAQTILGLTAGQTSIVVDDRSGFSIGKTVTIPGAGTSGGDYTGTVTSVSNPSGTQTGTIGITPAIGTTTTAYAQTATVQDVPGVYVGTEVGAPSGGSITITPALSSNVANAAVIKTAQWDELYNGTFNDPIYTANLVSWLTTARDYIHNLNGCLTANIGYVADQDSASMANAVDVVYDEIAGDSFPSECLAFDTTGQGQAWVDKINYIKNLTVSGYVLENSICPLGDLNRDVLNAAVGMYLLVKTAHTYMTWYFASDSDTGGLSNFLDNKVGGQWPEVWWEHGPATEEMQNDGHLYWRHFANGMAICNPWPNTAYPYDFKTSRYHSFDNLPWPSAPNETTVQYVVGPGCVVLKSGPPVFGGWIVIR